MAIAAVFTLVWNIQSKQLHDIFNDKIGDNDLPHWINASQRMPNNVFSDLILEGDLYYQVPEFNQKTSFFGGLNRDKRVHNPLIYIATLFSPLPKITEDEQVKILKNQFDSRHDMHDRLWTGKDLRISSITTKASINSSVRTAYTEKILTIENSGRDGTWRPNLQEAFFTLYMPDGAVVSSLSLWVNGKEEKSRLSSKSKADSAYTTIVGRERRDPALVHWQEGNTVTLRVFPCTPQEARKVKIGYTAPLREEDGNLIYDNMTLQGPPATGSIEDLNIKIESNNTKDILEMPGFFNKNNDGILTAKTKYTPDWQIKLRGVNFEPQSFTFNNKTYRAEPIVLEKENFIPEAIYLDLNNAWSANEVYHILKNTPNIPIRVWLDSEFKTLQLSDYQSFIKNKLSFSYSLFPFHKLPMPEKSLVISKSSGISPLLVELKDTKFGEEMKARLNNSLTRLFHIGSDCSPYIDALRQMRLVQLHTGNLAQLIELLNKNEFYKNPEDENSVVIANSGLRITREAAAIPAISSRNDHLMRLFAYHNILKEIGSKNLTDNYEPAALVREAEEAFVVTPVSSMVVLETKADYERMGIDKNTSTLGNASFKNNGAVPEPHEWALIGLLIIALLWVWKRNWI
jgi:XrtN system VIT domain protein